MEELQKALNEKGLKISTLPGKGRCLFTTRDFSPGEVIISQSPYVAVPLVYEESPKSKCEWCFSSSNIKACSACRAVWYCSITCQKSDWKLHREECKSLSKVEKERLKFLDPMIRLMGKLCIRCKLEKEENFPATATDNCKLVEALVSHISDVDQKQLVSYTQMATLVNVVLKWPSSEINIKEIAENFSKLSCNSHTIIDSQLVAIGTGLYPVISLTNHSCVPNCVLVFEGRSAVIRAMQHMPKDTEVLTSYIETAVSTVTRQTALKQKYFFTCSCPRCIKLGQPDDIRESAILEGYRCKDSKCDGFLLPESDNEEFVCQKCGLIRYEREIRSTDNEVKSITAKASVSLSSGHTSEANLAYKRIEELQLKLYQPYSINNLPPEITIEVLSRLPVRTIARCKCVRKSWRDLLRTREFVDCHLSKSASGIVTISGRSSYVKINEFVDEIDLERHELHYIPVAEFESTDFIFNSDIRGSANGVIYLGPIDPSDPGLYIWNPVTREYMILSEYPNDPLVYSSDTYLNCGFGVSKSGEYKVVRIFHACIRDRRTFKMVRVDYSVGHVYTLGTRKWRSIANCAPFAKEIRLAGAFYNGSLYWFVTDFRGSNVISCFDLEAETFSLLSPPPLVRKEKCRGGLVSLGDCLCMFDSTSRDEVVIWLMKENGDEKTWTKYFVMMKSHKHCQYLYPIKVFKDGDILIACVKNSGLFYYSNKTKTSIVLDMFGVRKDARCISEAIFHRLSFLSLESCFPTEIVRPF